MLFYKGHDYTIKLYLIKEISFLPPSVSSASLAGIFRSALGDKMCEIYSVNTFTK